MKKTEHILDAIGDVGDDLLRECENAGRKVIVWKPIAAAAACFALVISIWSIMPKELASSPIDEIPMETESEVGMGHLTEGIPEIATGAPESAEFGIKGNATYESANPNGFAFDSTLDVLTEADGQTHETQGNACYYTLTDEQLKSIFYGMNPEKLSLDGGAAFNEGTVYDVILEGEFDGTNFKIRLSPDQVPFAPYVSQEDGSSIVIGNAEVFSGKCGDMYAIWGFLTGEERIGFRISASGDDAPKTLLGVAREIFCDETSIRLSHLKLDPKS